MIEALSTAVATSPVETGVSIKPAPAAGASSSSAGPTAPAPAATRAYVERSDSGVYVYRLVDVATGRVLVELPRAESAALQISQDYTPGAAAARAI